MTTARLLVCVALASLLVSCTAARQAPANPPPALPDAAAIIDVASGARLTPSQLADRLRAADFVLLGEQHDNPAHHRIRGALVASAGRDRASVVFEHWPRGVVPRPDSGESRTAWLDRTGFDRKGWRWPLHEPLVDAVIASGPSWRGSNVSREALRDVVRTGADAAPYELRMLMERAPLDSIARAVIDAEIVTGHCGQLPVSMVPGMRDAQVVRDAAMADAMLEARASGAPWLMAGNGHVRADVAVPRFLKRMAPGAKVEAVGFLEVDASGALPATTPTGLYDVVVITPRAAREDACASFKAPAKPGAGSSFE